MVTQKDDGYDLSKELAARLADSELAREKLEASNAALQEEVERKNKVLEDFISENKALKEELGGKASLSRIIDNDCEETVSLPQIGRRAERLTRALLEAAQRRETNG